MISHVMTLANSIIGVSVLAMPFCFKQCGIILATLVLLLSSLLSRLACHFLIKSAVMSRRRNFEFLAFHAFGPMGKFLAELCIIGFLLGTCIAFFVVVGDLGPQIIGEMIDKKPEDIRNSLLITTGIFIVLPLGLLRNVDSLASVSTASIGFYICLVLKVMAESTHHIFAVDWFEEVHFWRSSGILQCLPIFALALFCQTQLFEIYETMPNATLERMNQVVRGALNICTVVYVSVGCFGYIAFCNQPFTGNILMSFEPSLTSEIIKIGFVLSVAFSFPLVIFPCRASLNSLLYRRGYAHEMSTTYITETRFRCLTTFIVVISLIIGIIIPNIEFVLGIIGSTIGVVICIIFPAAFFISISTKNTNERLLAQIIIFIGMWIMILGTYANLYAMEQSTNLRATATTSKLPSQMNNIALVLPEGMMDRPGELKHPENLLDLEVHRQPKPKAPDKSDESENVRQEPPVPVERVPESEKLKEKLDSAVLKLITISPKIQKIVNKINDMEIKQIEKVNKEYESLQKNDKPVKLLVHEKVNIPINAPVEENGNKDPAQKNDVIAVDAIKKEESELAADKEISNVDPVQRREQLEKTLEKHNIEKKKLIEEQKKLLKDIEQTKREFNFVGEKEIEPAKDKNSIVESNGTKDDPKNEGKIDSLTKNENNNKDGTAEKRIEVKSQVFQDSKPLDLANHRPENKLEKKKNLNNGDQNKSLKDQKSNDQIDQKNKNEKSLPNSEADLKQPPDILPDIKSEGLIIRALTKKTNDISSRNEKDIPDVQVEKNNKIVEINDINKEHKKSNEDSIQTALKMNNQTNLSDPKRSQINQSNDAAAARRNILEKHHREKRMADIEQTDDAKTAINETTQNRKDDVVYNDTITVQENCDKEEKRSQIKNLDDKVESKKVFADANQSEMIKTIVYLFEQDVVETVPINSALTAGGGFVKLKTRDLKALEFESNKKK